MSQQYVIPTKFTAVDGMSSVVKGMERNLHSFSEKANAGLAKQEALFRKLTPSLSGAAKNLLNYASAGALLGGAAYSGKAIMEYETAIQSLSAVTGVSGTELEKYKLDISDLAKETKKSAIDVAGSYEIIGSAMSQYLNDPRALHQISEAGITLAKASRQELVPTLENLTSIMNQFDIQASKATETVNRLTAGEIVGSLRTSQVAEALQEFGAGAYSANINLSESVALVEALAKQMKTDKIGVGARNIITVLDSAKGLDKKARKDLRASGVDLGFLMNKSKSLSERLHELSKISGNATTITSVFGKENRTAAQVIFNQLGTYDAYLAKIKTTNEAQKQAATNSNTLAQTVEQLKNTWINYITTSDVAASGTEKLKNIIHYVTENLDTIVSVGVNVVKFFVAWKAVMIATKIVTVGLNVALGIQNVLQLESAALIEGNIIAQRAAAVTETLWAGSIALASGNMAAFNAILLANPIGLVVVGLAALATATYFAYQKTKELREEYEKKIKLDTTSVINNESAAVEKLANKYWLLGLNVKQANALAVRTEKVNIDSQRRGVESEISGLQKTIDERKRRNVSMMQGFGVAVNAASGDSEDNKKLLSLQEKAKDLAVRGQASTQLAKDYVDNGLINKSDLGNTFQSPSRKPAVAAVDYFGSPAPKRGNGFDFMGNKREAASDTDKILIAAIERMNKTMDKVADSLNQPVNINVSNSGSTSAGGSSIKVSSPKSH